MSGKMTNCCRFFLENQKIFFKSLINIESFKDNEEKIDVIIFLKINSILKLVYKELYLRHGCIKGVTGNVSRRSKASVWVVTS